MSLEDGLRLVARRDRSDSRRPKGWENDIFAEGFSLTALRIVFQERLEADSLASSTSIF